MAAGKKEKHISPNEEKLNEGLKKAMANPLFGRLLKEHYIYRRRNDIMGRDTAAIVTSNGTIWVNKDFPMSPDEWAYTIAHCQLHLSFGHFDAENMPGYETEDINGRKLWKPSIDRSLWNLACDIYISKFLADIKFGKPTCAALSHYSGPLTDERKIYSHLLENELPECGFAYGTASEHHPDMSGLEKPLVYNKERGERNNDTVRFAQALAHSVKEVVTKAGGYSYSSSKKKTAAELAAEWFINHYPLLGGLASGFKITEDYEVCIRNDISIAAVDVAGAEILVNPAAGLNNEELKFVLAHEFLHAGLQHHERFQGRDPYLWNVACDYVINAWLSDMQIGEMPQNGLLYDEGLKNFSAEEIYDRITTDLKKYSKLDTLRGYGKGDILGRGFGFPTGSAVSLDDFYKSALQNGLEYHSNSSRGYIPAGLIEEIRALAMPPIPWDAALAQWFDIHFTPPEKRRSYARPSRRQGSTPDIPRPRYTSADIPEHSRTFGVVLDTSGSMSTRLLGYALGAIASYSAAKEVPFARVVFCDALAYDAGYLSPGDIAGHVTVKGRGGTILQPGVDLLVNAKDFPKDGPILIITDGYIENDLKVKREHAFLVPKGRRLPFRAKGKVFYFSE